MDLKKIIRTFYIVYTIYVILLIGSTNLEFLKVALSIIFMWINYMFFSMGYSFRKKPTVHLNQQKTKVWLIDSKKKVLLIVSGLSIIFSIAAVKYYTGQTPIDVFKNLSSNISVYYQYQYYFKEKQRHLFSITKIPFILMLFYVKFILFYSYVSFLVTKEKSATKYEKTYLILITLSYLYIGMARGTSFEFFELLVLIIYIMFSKYNYKKGSSIKLKPIITSIVLATVGIYIFVSGISARGVKFDPSILRTGVNYSYSKWVSTLFPFISLIVFRMYSYFGFGFYYISTYLTDVWFSSLGNFVSGMIPLGHQLNVGYSIPDIMTILVDVGVKWHPDSMLIVNKLGYIGLLILCFLMGVFSKYFYIIEERKPVVELTNYIILLGMISLPVGNFLFTSSANQLIIMLLSIYWFWRIFIRLRIRL